MTEGVLSQWVKDDGDQVRKGGTLAVIETDKAAMEMEAYGNDVLTTSMTLTLPIDHRPCWWTGYGRAGCAKTPPGSMSGPRRGDAADRHQGPRP